MTGAADALSTPEGRTAGRADEPDGSEREREKRADARAERLHLVGLTNAAVIIMGVVLGAVVVMLVLVVVSHH